MPWPAGPFACSDAPHRRFKEPTCTGRHVSSNISPFVLGRRLLERADHVTAYHSLGGALLVPGADEYSILARGRHPPRLIRTVARYDEPSRRSTHRLPASAHHV